MARAAAALGHAEEAMREQIILRQDSAFALAGQDYSGSEWLDE